LEAYCIACLPALGQGHVLLSPTSSPPIAVVGPPTYGDEETFSLLFTRLAASLVGVEQFYDSLGGLVGYQLQCLTLIQQHQKKDVEAVGEVHTTVNNIDNIDKDMELLIPDGLDLSSPHQATEAKRAIIQGLHSLPLMSEIYPLGGAGDRLGLKCETTGDPLPTAVLEYAGRPSLLDWLIRDLQGREYLYWKLSGKQTRTPVAVMTSAAKGNHWRVVQMFEESGWFGRGREGFRLFQQPLVPVVSAENGRWLLCSCSSNSSSSNDVGDGPPNLKSYISSSSDEEDSGCKIGDIDNAMYMNPHMKPGGHGVIWKLMKDKGVLEWLRNGHGRQAAIIRQISNPMAGTDNTLLALAGAANLLDDDSGTRSTTTTYNNNNNDNNNNNKKRRSFGFASCERVVGAAEGMNVLLKRRISGTNGSSKYSTCVTNIEYTEFAKLGIQDVPREEGALHSAFPANTNVLYVGLDAVENAVASSIKEGSTDAILPGMILNMNKEVVHRDPEAGWEERKEKAGRLECTMQNLADCLADPMTNSSGSSDCDNGSDLQTFLVYNRRSKVTSSAKRKLKPGSTKVHQTPHGSFYDLQSNAAELLQHHCNMQVPPVPSVQQYLDKGPSFIFLYHPGLGPLWSVVGQKIQGGGLGEGAEVRLEVAEAMLVNVQVDGSLLVLADRPLGYYHSSNIDDVNSNDKVLQFSDDECGRVKLHNVIFINQGIDWTDGTNVYWKGRVNRKESCSIILKGRSEFEARDVTIDGNVVFEVPHGYKMTISNSGGSSSNSGGKNIVGAPANLLGSSSGNTGGGYKVEVHALDDDGPSWRWRYILNDDDDIILQG